MPVTLILTILCLIAFVLIGRQYSGLPNNIWRLFLAQPFAMSATPAVVIAASILAVAIAPDPELATLPLTLMIIGTAVAVIPATWCLSHFGRKKGSMLGLLFGFFGAVLSAIAALYSDFHLLLAGTFMMGLCSAFIAQLRFAALESVSNPNQAPKAISTLMASGLFSAMLGPEIAVVAKDWVESPHGFVGSFIVLAGFMLLAIVILSRLDPMDIKESHYEQKARSIVSFFKNPVFIVALCSGVVAYSVMSYLMTASPLSMHSDHAYDMASIKWVVQSHVLAMYVPSLFSAYLVSLLGIRKLMLLGTALYALVVIVSLMGHSVMHYWWSMVLLGVGWNLLYLCGTLLLPNVYQAHERFKVQAVNDFSIFGIQGIASLSAGIILYNQGWAVLVSITIPVIILMLIVTLWYISIIHKSKLDKVEEFNGQPS